MSSQGRAIHFYKIIGENSIRNGELRIPRSFVSEYWEGMSNPVFLLLPNGAKWEVTWKKHGADVWLSNNWNKFAEFYSLDRGHLLVFSYERKSQFRVVIFDQSALEIGYPLFQASFDGEESGNPLENFDGFSTRKSKRPKSPMPFPHSPKKMKTNPKEESKCYSSHDVETNTTQSQRTKLEMKRFHADYDNTKPKNRGRKRTIYVPSSSALERAKAFCTKNPSFIREMHPTYIQKHELAIPGRFITARQHKENDSATLWVSEERTWDVKFTLARCNGQIWLSTGWKNFVEDNNLKVGDACVFEQTKSEGVSFRVVIFRAREGSSPPRFQAYGDGPQNNFAKRDCGGIAKKCSRTTNVFDDSEFPRNNSRESEKNHFTLSLNPAKLKNAKIPMEFIRKYEIDEVEDVTLRVGKRSWAVKLDYYPESRYAKFSTGWSAFVRDCNLKAGDVCRFELVDREYFVLQVTISVPID